MKNTTWIFPHCPDVNRPIDWLALIEQFEWLRSLSNCPQDPIYHAEGDVLTHTKLVCEALVSLSAWQQLPPVERSLLFAAALLHDVAKPQATQEVEERINSKGHVRQGARLARCILRDLDAPFQVRPEQDQGAVIYKAKQLAKEMLRSQTSFVWNATNISQQLRAGLIDLFAAYRARTQIVYLEVPWQTLLQQNRQRPQPVPEIAIARLFERLEVPSLVEAHQVEVLDFEHSNI